MFQVESLVLLNEKLNKDSYRMVIDSAEITSEAKPGQFLMVRITEINDPLFRRPFSIFRRTVTKFVTELLNEAEGVSGIEVNLACPSADAICPNYSVMGMAIDIETRRSKLGKNLIASVGGPWMKPISLRLVWQAAQSVRIPIIGGGGISCAEDAIEFFIAGARAVQVGIFNVIDPKIMPKIIGGIKKYLSDHNIKRLADLIGTLNLS